MEMKAEKNTNKDCIFCKFIRKEIVPTIIWEDKDYLAFLDQNPINPGHVLLIPKEHTDYLFDLNDKEYGELMLNAKKIAKLLKNKLGCKRVGLAVEGFFVPHVHIHIVPLNKGNELNPERAKHNTPEELIAIARKITGK